MDTKRCRLMTIVNRTKIDRIFNISTEEEFNSLAMEIFSFQYRNNPVYKQFCDYLGRTPITVPDSTEIPFLPIEFFKTMKVSTGSWESEAIFSSSGTTGNTVSKHHIADLALYQRSFIDCFVKFYGPPEGFCILALLPSYLERAGSSLVYMVDELIKRSEHQDSGFYLSQTEQLMEKILQLEAKGTKTLLLGVSYALLDMAEKYKLKLKNTIIMETGGMKGRRKEMIREELHLALKKAFGVNVIHSEYGMTELLSQAYSKGHGVFSTPPWMRVGLRDTEDPLNVQSSQKTGGINIIDLANVYSCSFIATQDLGKVKKDGTFEILGRFDHSDIRGCNLMAL